MRKLTKETIKNARIKSKLTQQEAADIVCVNLRTWQRWESGDRNMSETAWILFDNAKDIVFLHNKLGSAFPGEFKVYKNFFSKNSIFVYYTFTKDKISYVHPIDIEIKNKGIDEILLEAEKEIVKFRSSQLAS